MGAGDVWGRYILKLQERGDKLVEFYQLPLSHFQVLYRESPLLPLYQRKTTCRNLQFELTCFAQGVNILLGWGSEYVLGSEYVVWGGTMYLLCVCGGGGEENIELLEGRSYAWCRAGGRGPRVILNF